jgi:hypothetical protein
VDDEAKTVTVDGEQVPVTPIEYGILKLLTENAGKVFSMDKIYEAVWNEPSFNPENTVAVHIRRIREKIEINPKDPRYLKVCGVLDIKLKNFNRRRMLDRTAFFLCVVLFLLALAGGAAIFDQSSRTVYEGGIDDLLFFDSYQKSSAFQMEFDRQLNDILYLLDQYKSEEYIKEGMTIHDDRMEEALRSLYYGGYNYSGNMIIEGELPYQRYGGRDFDEPGLRKQFAEDYSAQIEEVKRQMIMDDLRDYQALKKHLDQIKGFTYFATDGTYSITNLSDKTNPAGTAMVNNVKKKESYLIYENDTLTKFPSSSGGDNRFAENYDRHLESRLDDYYNPDLIVYFSFGKSFLDEKEAEFSQARAEILRWIPMVIACTAGALILLIYLLVMTGRRDEEGNVPVYWADRVFTELQLLIIGFLFVGGGLMFGKFMLSSVTYGIGIGGVIYKSSSPLYLSIALGAIVGLFSAGFGLCCILSVVRISRGKIFEKLPDLHIRPLFGRESKFNHGQRNEKVVLVTLAVCVASRPSCSPRGRWACHHFRAQWSGIGRDQKGVKK